MHATMFQSWQKYTASTQKPGTFVYKLDRKKFLHDQNTKKKYRRFQLFYELIYYNLY